MLHSDQRYCPSYQRIFSDVAHANENITSLEKLLGNENASKSIISKYKSNSISPSQINSQPRMTKSKTRSSLECVRSSQPSLRSGSSKNRSILVSDVTNINRSSLGSISRRSSPNPSKPTLTSKSLYGLPIKYSQIWFNPQIKKMNKSPSDKTITTDMTTTTGSKYHHNEQGVGISFLQNQGLRNHSDKTSRLLTGLTDSNRDNNNNGSFLSKCQIQMDNKNNHINPRDCSNNNSDNNSGSPATTTTTDACVNDNVNNGVESINSIKTCNTDGKYHDILVLSNKDHVTELKREDNIEGKGGDYVTERHPRHHSRHVQSSGSKLNGSNVHAEILPSK